MAEEEKPQRTVDRMPPPTHGTEINFPLIFKIGLGMIFAAVIIHLGIWVLFRQLQSREVHHDPRLSPLVSRQPQLPPGPRLQVLEPVDLKKFHDQEDAILNNYGWVNKQAGTVRIPVNEAMKLMLQQAQTQGSGK